jgi:N,N'-diacetyllegionaminate synthase
MRSVIIIAEAGVNHGGSLSIAKQMAEAAGNAGADYVKFQTFDPDAVVAADGPTAEYQQNHGYTDQRSMLAKLKLSEAEHQELKNHCDDLGVGFLSTAFDLGSVELLRRLGQKTWKIPSGEITNVPLIERIGQIAREVIMSTGMATLGEIEQALSWLERAGCIRDRVTVLHCNTEYPTPYEDVNLRAMRTIADAFGVRVGYSDHTLGTEVPVAAVAMGARVIEKHFTLDRSAEGPDHRASLEPEELSAMVARIRHVEAALGDGLKRVSESERKNRRLVRKGIYAARAISKGERFSAENVTTKRPSHGTDAALWGQVLETAAQRDYEPDEAIEL